jgi:hypothetical protein
VELASGYRDFDVCLEIEAFAETGGRAKTAV